MRISAPPGGTPRCAATSGGTERTPSRAGGGGTSGPGYQTGANNPATQHGAVITQPGCSESSPSRLLPLVRGSDPWYWIRGRR